LNNSLDEAAEVEGAVEEEVAEVAEAAAEEDEIVGIV
jgi:hypothetical protein